MTDATPPPCRRCGRTLGPKHWARLAAGPGRDNPRCQSCHAAEAHEAYERKYGRPTPA